MTKRNNFQTTYELAIIPTEEPKQSDTLACLEWIVEELLKQEYATASNEKSPRICIYGDYYFPSERRNHE